MTIRPVGTAKAPMQQATRLIPDVQVNTNGISSFGSVAAARGYSSNSRRIPTAFVVVCDNSAGVAAQLYMIGDPQGMVAGKFGITAIPPTSAQGITVAALTASFIAAPVLVKGINYQATSGEIQFSQRFQFGDADLDRGQLTDLVVPQFVRNTAQNPNLLTLEFGEGFELDWNAGFILSAGIAQRVTLTFMIGAAAGR